LKKKTVVYQFQGFLQGTIVNLARVVLLWWGAVLAYKNLLSFSNVILFNFYSFTVYQPLYDLGDVTTKYTEGIAAVDRLQSVLNVPVTIQDAPDAKRVDKIKGKIEFRNVSFDYGTDRPILKDISFLVEPGKKLALVGQTGSGKSTIVKLLLRFYEPTAGQIFIDDLPLDSYESESLRRRFGLVLQDNVLFNTSIGANISYGSPETTEDDIVDAAQRASLQPFLAKLEHGIKSLVGERGLQVSGGEKQRIAIARAIIRRPDVLIFDEATSALDSHTEEQIRQSILEVSKGVTSITVAHRFSTVIDSDEIILLVDGHVTERGTHQQLLALNGTYSSIYNMQTQRRQAEEIIATTVE